LRNNLSQDGSVLRNIENSIGASLEKLDTQLNMMPASLVSIQTEVNKGSTAIRQEIIDRLESLLLNQDAALKKLLNDIQSLLKKHNSDIEVAIRNEGTQIQRGIENVVTEKHFTIQNMMGQQFGDMSIKLRRYSFIGFALMGINVIFLVTILLILRV
jgi:hypothetical protein